MFLSLKIFNGFQHNGVIAPHLSKMPCFRCKCAIKIQKIYKDADSIGSSVETTLKNNDSEKYKQRFNYVAAFPDLFH